MAQQQPARRSKARASNPPISIPDKLYFRIGDVARLCGLPAYVLRFWESEFPQLKPNKGGTGQRLYRKRDVEMVIEIKRLLYEEGFTIAGARRLLAEKRRTLPGISAGQSAAPSAGQSKDAAGQPPQKASRPLAAAPAAAPDKSPEVKKSAPRPAPARPDIRELRAEMRELLTLLEPDRSARSSPPAPPRRESKKTRPADEPTLF